MSDSNGVDRSEALAQRAPDPSVSSSPRSAASESGYDSPSPAEAACFPDFTDHAMGEYVLIQQMTSVQHLARELAHDFRNMIMSIAGLVLQLEMAQPTEIVAGKADAIRSVLASLEDLVNHLYSIGSPEGPDSPRQVQDLSTEVEHIVRALRPSIGPAVELTLHPCGQPLPVLMSRGSLSRIASNLLLNARDAMPFGGRMRVSLYLSELDLEYCRLHGNARPGFFAVLRVDDEGSGIPPEVLPRIFEPLFSTKTPSHSTDRCKRGWGLATVYALVSSQDGWIVETHLGAGSRFEVFLPLCVESSSEAPG